jgi:hypothetical protein
LVAEVEVVEVTPLRTLLLSLEGVVAEAVAATN